MIKIGGKNEERGLGAKVQAFFLYKYWQTLIKNHNPK